MGSQPPLDQWKKGKAEIVITKKTPTVAVEVKDGRVLTVYPCSDLLSHVYTGDYIEAVNGQKVNTTTDMTAAILSKVPGKIIIEYRRDEHCTYNMKPLPSQRPGFELFEITLSWRSGGTPVGLLIHRDFSGQVVIAMVESGSTASKVIRPGDYLLKVNSTEIKDRDVARKKIMESINASKKVTMTLERQVLNTAAASVMAPPTDPPKSEMQPKSCDYTPTTYGAPPTQPGSQITPNKNSNLSLKPTTINKKLDVVLPEDVLAILTKNKDFFKIEPPSGPALKKIKAPPAPVRVDLTQEKHDEQTIPYDPSPKPLKVTPKRVGS